MNKSFLIGIPIRDLINPMSRLSTVLSGEERIQLSKNLIINLQNSFASIETEIYIISNSQVICSDPYRSAGQQVPPYRKNWICHGFQSTGF